MELTFDRGTEADKITVTRLFSTLVAEERASWHVNTRGKLELHFSTGERFLIGENSVTRVG